MSYQRLQPTKAIAIVPVDGLKLPESKVAGISGVTSLGTNKLFDSTSAVNFIEVVPIGSTVYNLLTGTGATVVGVNGQYELTLSADIFTAVGEIYVVGKVGRGAAIWSGTGGDISGYTAGGDEIFMPSVPPATMIPVLMSVINATDTTATDMYALY